MFKKVRKTIAYWISKEIKAENFDLRKIADEAQMKADQKYAHLVLSMDPFEPVMKQFHGIFSDEYEHVEENLDVKSRFMLISLGYQLRDDPSFKHLAQWVMNTQGNQTLKRSPVTTETLIYGRAQISSMLSFVKEIGRLASLYEEEIDKDKKNEFDSNLSVE